MRHVLPYLALLLLVACGQDPKLQPGITGIINPEEQPTQVSYNTTLHFSSEGKQRATLLAGRIRVYDRRKQTVLDSSVRVDFFDKQGKHSSALTARWANINDVTRMMVAYDSVKIVSDSGTTVYTDSLTWDNQTQRISSPAFVRIVEKNGRVTTGHGFESDQTLSNYKILRTTIVAPGSSLEDMSPRSAPRTNAPIGSPSAPLFDVPDETGVPSDTGR